MAAATNSVIEGARFCFLRSTVSPRSKLVQTVSFSPFCGPSSNQHRSRFDKECVLCDVGPHLHNNRLLAACVLLRGTQDQPAVMPDGVPRAAAERI